MSKKPQLRIFIRTFAIELLVYGVLLTAYFLLALRFLGQPLTRLLENNLVVYGFAALGLVVAQGELLDALTSLLVRLLGEKGAPDDFIEAVTHAIAAHRFRNDVEPHRLEAKVLFDADKLDSIGAVGVARSSAAASCRVC